MTNENLAVSLAQFTGTEGYYHWSALFRNWLLTDGTKYLAEQAGCYWLMDLVASHAPQICAEGFASVKLEMTGANSGVVTIDDGNGNVLATQTIEYTNFPLKSVQLFVAQASETQWAIMLPGEY